jgi:hypothetical protein
MQFGSAEQAEQDGAELGESLANREDVTHAEQVDDPVHGGRLRDQAHRTAAHRGQPTGHQERPQAGAVHERDPGQVEQQRRAVPTHHRQHHVPERLGHVGVDVSARPHDGAAIPRTDM